MTKIRVKRGLSENLDSVSIEGEKMNRIKFRRGSLNNKKNIDIEDGEPIYLTDTKRLYVSNEDVAINNVYVGSQEPNDPGINVWIDSQGINNVVDMTYPIGSIYISATNTDPSSTFGGTWELIDKGFKDTYENYEDTVFTKTSNISSCQLALTRSSKTIRIRLNMTSATTLNDTTKLLLTIDWEKLGLTRLTSGYIQYVGASDGGNAIFICSIDYADGDVSVLEVIGKTTNEIIEGKELLIDFTFNCYMQYMIDSFCDKFYWKRTA